MNLIIFRPDEKTISYNGKILSVNNSDYRAQHIKDVLKTGIGECVKIGFLGDGNYSLYRLLSYSDGMMNLEKTPDEFKSESLNPLALILGTVRPICMKRILRDCAALGVGKLILTTGENCEKSYANSGIYKSGEYLDYLLDGAMQAGSTKAPEVLFASSVKDALAMTSGCEFDKVLFDNIIGARPACKTVSDKASGVLAAIGPERGWTDGERKLFLESGFSPVLMGRRIMRTETAVPAGCALLLNALGRM